MNDKKIKDMLKVKGNILNENESTKKKVGAPKKAEKRKMYSIYLTDKEVSLVCEIFGGTTPNNFLKFFIKNIIDDNEKLLEIILILYGERSKEYKNFKILENKKELK